MLARDIFARRAVCGSTSRPLQILLPRWGRRYEVDANDRCTTADEVDRVVGAYIAVAVAVSDWVVGCQGGGSELPLQIEDHIICQINKRIREKSVSF